jgi:hypothetical protein
MTTRDDLTAIVSEVVKAGTTAGAKKGWESRKHGGFSTKESHAEYMGLHRELASAIDTHGYSRHDAEKEYRKQFERGKHFSKVAYDSHKKIQQKADRQITDLKARQKELELTGQHEHPEWGKFVRVPGKSDSIGGSSVTYKSPSGHKVEHYGFGGWHMQRVAASHSVESEYGKKRWSGEAGDQASDNFLKKVYGIGATDAEKNELVKYKPK